MDDVPADNRLALRESHVEVDVAVAGDSAVGEEDGGSS